MQTQTADATLQLIDQLTASLPTRRKFRSPLIYLSIWLVASLVYVISLANVMLSIRFDLALRLTDLNFLATVTCMFLGAACFAYSSLLSSLPGQKDRLRWLGLGATLAWVGLIVYGMVCDLPGLLGGRVFFNFDRQVFLALVAGGSLPLLGLWLIVRHLAPMRPARVALSISLASFMLTATVLRFYYVSLYNGADCSFNLFFWMLLPLMLSTAFGWAGTTPFLKWSPRRKSGKGSWDPAN